MSSNVNECKPLARGVLAELHKERPTVRLVYVTPEKLAGSDALWSCLEDLHANGQVL